MRVVVDSGKLVEFRSISDPHSILGGDYDAFLEYQVYHLDGTPSTGSYRGQGSITNGRLILGDPYTHVTLTEYVVDREPTKDSRDRFEGFLQGLDDKRKHLKVTKKTQGKSELWWDGYRDAWQQKAERARQKNPQEIATDFVSQHYADTTWRQRIPGGTTRPPCEFDRSALAAGLAVELEHTTDPAIALEIAMDHLDEDPSYYAKHSNKRKRRRVTNPALGDSRTARISRRVSGA